MRVADTSALYALFAVEDVHHTKALRAFEDPEKILVPAEILSETLSLIQFRRGFQPALKAGKWMRGLPHLEVRPSEPSVLAIAWEEFELARGRLSYPDSLVIAHARDQGLDPIAFDKQITKRMRRK